MQQWLHNDSISMKRKDYTGKIILINIIVAISGMIILIYIQGKERRGGGGRSTTAGMERGLHKVITISTSLSTYFVDMLTCQHTNTKDMAG